MSGSTSRTPERTTVDERRAADQPTDLPRGAWRDVIKRTLREYKADNLGDLAAALTYYAVLAIFPMLIVLVSLLGLLGQSVTQPLIDNLAKVAPGAARQIFTSAVHNIQANQGTAGVLLSSAWRARCGRPRVTSQPSCVPQMSSGMSKRDDRSGKRSRSASG